MMSHSVMAAQYAEAMAHAHDDHDEPDEDEAGGSSDVESETMEEAERRLSPQDKEARRQQLRLQNMVRGVEEGGGDGGRTVCPAVIVCLLLLLLFAVVCRPFELMRGADMASYSCRCSPTHPDDDGGGVVVVMMMVVVMISSASFYSHRRCWDNCSVMRSTAHHVPAGHTWMVAACLSTPSASTPLRWASCRPCWCVTQREWRGRVGGATTARRFEQRSLAQSGVEGV